MIFGKTITSRFIAIVIIALLVTQSLGVVIFTVFSRSALLDSLRQRVERVGALTAGLSVAPLLTYDYALVDTYLDEVIRDDDIAAVRIFDAKNKLVKERSGKTGITARGGNIFFIKPVVSVRMPVTAGGDKLGDVEIDYRRATVVDILTRSLVVFSLYQLVVFVGLGIIMFTLFGREIKRPLLEIKSALERITLGDLTVKVPDLGENEIGTIAKGVGYLKDRLSATVGKLTVTLGNVHTALKQVNATYVSVTDGMTRLSSAVKDVTRSVQVAAASQQEIGEGSEKLSNFSAENLSSLLELRSATEEIAVQIQRLFKSTENSHSVVVEMHQSSKAISGISSDASREVENTSASLEEISASVKQVEDHARESSAIADRVKEVTSTSGMMSVVNATEGIENISTEVKHSAEIIRRLGARSVDIEKVLSVIKDVTEQTNLLSLNAAILAEQAGEYGKSFSVVADEIRALSERTATSTREIGGIVKTIQKDIKDAVASVDSAGVRVEQGSSLILKVGEALREILNASVQSADMTKAIERATREQAAGLRQTSAAIEEIRKLMQNVARSTREEDSALGYLLEAVSEVKEVAEASKRGAEEQVNVSKGIAKNIEMANERINHIKNALLQQHAMDTDIASAVEQINAVGTATMRDMGGVSDSLKVLFDEIETLRREMEVFKAG